MIFYTTTVAAIPCFLLMARDWPELMRDWKVVEESMSGRYSPLIALKRRLAVTTFVFLSAAALEHALSMVNFVYGERCDWTTKVSTTESYFLRQFDCVFNYIEYSSGLAAILTVRNTFVRVGIVVDLFFRSTR